MTVMIVNDDVVVVRSRVGLCLEELEAWERADVRGRGPKSACNGAVDGAWRGGGARAFFSDRFRRVNLARRCRTAVELRARARTETRRP